MAMAMRWALCRPRWSLVIAIVQLGCAAVGTDVGHIEFANTHFSLQEQETFLGFNLLRKGGASGEVSVMLGLSNDTTATLGSDFRLFQRSFSWSDGDTEPRAFTVQIMDDAVFEEVKRIKLKIETLSPVEARGVESQELEIEMLRDNDGGTIVFSGESLELPIKEFHPDEDECLIYASREGGTSGVVRLSLEVSVGCLYSSLPQANEWLDFEYQNGKELLTWEDGEDDRKCLLYNQARRTEVGEEVNRILILPDQVVEGRVAVCFKPVLSGNSTATVSVPELDVAIEDEGETGGDHLSCHRGVNCLIEFNMSTSSVRPGDDMYFSQVCFACPALAAAGPPDLSLPEVVNHEIVHMDLGRGLNGLDPGAIRMCVCRRGLHTSWAVGEFNLFGPTLSNTATCLRGQPFCSIPPLDGNWPLLWEHQDEHLQVLLDCQDPSTTAGKLFYGSHAAVESDGGYVLRNKTTLALASAGIYKLCWCTGSFESNCSSMSEYSTEAGRFILEGPHIMPPRVIDLNESWILRGVSGIGLSRMDQVRLMRTCGVDDDEPFLEAEPYEGDPNIFDFGMLLNEKVPAVEYQLCWCRRDNSSNTMCESALDFRAAFGDIRVQCPGGLVSDQGTCGPCGYFSVPDDSHTKCVGYISRALVLSASIAAGLSAFIIIFLQVEISVFKSGKFWKLRLRGPRLRITDISREGDRVIITTRYKHRLSSHLGTIPIHFSGTGHDCFDDPEMKGALWRVRPDGARRLELLDRQGDCPKSPDSSMGSLRLSLMRMLLHVAIFKRLPVVVVFAVLLVHGICLKLTLAVVDTYTRRLTDEFLALTFFVELVAGWIVAIMWRARRRSFLTEMEYRLRQFNMELNKQNPNPQPVPRGPDRAVTAFQLFTLFDFFQSFIKKRTMYYLVPNIVEPLCRDHRLSYAERAGPNEVEWFISHFWGTDFCEFCEAVRRHAVDMSSHTDTWKSISYWICSFSNNQFEIQNELGTSHEESSFYLALRSGKCKGTCMILDEQALPLTRSWCLFELLQTIELERVQDNFVGLLFCTATGVLNHGAATVELSMNIGKKLARLSLQGAGATRQSDKDMIESLVIQAMGSFEEIDMCLRTHILRALEVCKDRVDGDFDTLFAKLARSSPIDHVYSSQESRTQSFRSARTAATIAATKAAQRNQCDHHDGDGGGRAIHINITEDSKSL